MATDWQMGFAAGRACGLAEAAVDEWNKIAAPGLETAKALAARVAELEAENERLKAELHQNRRAWASLPTIAAAPTTRPLTTADRLPEVGDVVCPQFYEAPLRVCAITNGRWYLQDGEYEPEPYSGGQLQSYAFPYLSRADGGPVTVEATPDA